MSNVARKTLMGHNLRKGMIPGGMSSPLSPGRNTERNTRAVVHRAATAFLKKRGINTPTFMGDAFGPTLAAGKVVP